MCCLFFSPLVILFFTISSLSVKFVAVFGTGFIFSIFFIYRTSVFTTFLVIQEFRIDLFRLTDEDP